MNCIFVCIFNYEKYIDMFYLLLESLFIYGNLDDNTEILIYTSTQFMNKIKKSHLYDENKINFELNDTYDNVDKACKARLDLFNLKSIKDYSKILYLDTDILVKDNINIIFEICKNDILYVLEEGSITEKNNYYGYVLFNNDFDKYEDKSGFSSGIMLFNNCEKIKNLFNFVNEEITNRQYNFFLHDQPYIVYCAIKLNLYNNKIFKSYVVNNNKNIKSDKVIHHFPGRPGVYTHKINFMTTFLNSIKDLTIINNIFTTKEFINTNLLPIIKNYNEKLESNIFMIPNTTIYLDTYLNKAKNICNLVLNKNIKKVLEIGFNSGFSALLMLITNPTIHITCFDLGEYKYTFPCYKKIKETFGERIKIVIGDSTKILPNYNDTFDLINIDGGTSNDVVTSDIINSYRLSKPRTILIMNNYELVNLQKIWNNYIEEFNLKQLKINLYELKNHNIKYV